MRDPNAVDPHVPDEPFHDVDDAPIEAILHYLDTLNDEVKAAAEAKHHAHDRLIRALETRKAFLLLAKQKDETRRAVNSVLYRLPGSPDIDFLVRQEQEIY